MLTSLNSLSQFGFELVHELTGGAARTSGVPAVPQKGTLLQVFCRDGQATFSGESGYDLQVARLVGRGKSQAQSEAARKGELLLHGVAGVNVVACWAVATFGEALPDQVPAVGGRVEPDVLGRLFDAAFEERLESLVLHLVLLEGEVVDEENETPATLAKDLEYLLQLREVLLLHLDQPQPLVSVLVHDSLDGGGLSGPRQAVQERVVGRQPGEKTLCVPDQRLPLPLVGDEFCEAHRVRTRDGQESPFSPEESSVAAVGSGSIPGVVAGQKLCARSPVHSRRELARDRATRRVAHGLGIRPGDPDAGQGRNGRLDPAEQHSRVQREHLPERAQIPPRLLEHGGTDLPPLHPQAEGVLVVEDPANEM